MYIKVSQFIKPNNSLMHIGYKIQKIRELLDISREQAAGHLNLSLETYGKIERCTLDPTEERLEKLASLFGTSVEYIKNFDPRQAMNNNFHNQNGDNVVTKNGADKLMLEMYERLLERVIILEKKMEK